MIIKQYKVTLLSDIVLNASLATEGNMESLDYISGSNFLGIVASHYDSFGDDGYDVFHNGKVIFGNAYVSKEDKQSFPIPIDIMRPKDEKRYPDTYYLNHSVDHTNDFIKGLQLKQQRVGYLDANGKYIKEIPKTFAIKSAHNAKERRSDEGKMFGFESLKKGSEFIFDVRFSDERLISKVEENLVGTKRLGKSKSAEFGSVKIESVTIPTIMSSFKTDTFILIYAASNLCFIDEDSGQPTLKPSVMQLTGQDIGKVDWSKSSIRTYTYSPYNGYRKTTSVQRDCIAKSSVFCITGLSHSENQTNEFYVGEHQSEGLGHIIINPKILEAGENGKLSLEILQESERDNLNPNTMLSEAKKPTSSLGKRLLSIEMSKNTELSKSESINIFIREIKGTDQKANKLSHSFSKITSSQWGAIRQMAEKPNQTSNIYTDVQNFISKGVASERHWDKDGGKARTHFLEAIKGKDSVFIVKLTSEIAKHINSFKPKTK